MTPEDYVPIFKMLKIKLIIRLNTPKYQAQKFIKHGFKVEELFFLDGSCPDNAIIKRFLEIVEEEEGGVAVHCKAGLGRTGTLIAMYCMKNYHFCGRDFIGWIRLCRPGSVLGPQQNFILDKEEEMWNSYSSIYEGLDPQFKKNNEVFKSGVLKEKIEYTSEDLDILKYGQKFQGENLTKMKAQM